ncbi:MAG: BlaI/MecI/CopY family transcriptional regulator [Pseudomonadales bacterium]
MPSLGELELAVLDHLWQVGEMTAKQTHAELGVSRGISLNTVQSTLERLARKALLERSKVGHAYRYSACVSREELIADLVGGVVGRLQGDAAASLLAFLDSVEQLDDDVLTRLEAELRRRRQQRGQ